MILTYIISGISFLIFVIIITIAAKAVNRGIQAKKNKIIYDEKEINENNLGMDEDNINLSEELKKIKDLYDSGALNEEEFKKAKDKLLN